MLPPWLRAPLGSTQVMRLVDEVVATGNTANGHVHVAPQEGVVVQPGYRTLITDAWIGLYNAGGDQSVLSYSSYYWELRVRNRAGNVNDSTLVTPRMPMALDIADNDQANVVLGLASNMAMSIHCAPLLSPIVVEEGHRCDYVITNAGAERTAYVRGWITGFTFPVLNDVPGAASYFTEGRR